MAVAVISPSSEEATMRILFRLLLLCLTILGAIAQTKADADLVELRKDLERLRG